MPNLNKVMLMGNITREPKLSYTPSQTEVVEFGLAINEKRGETEKTHFVEIVMFGKRAEVINKYLQKGDPIFIEGKLDYSSWEKDGQKHSKLKVIATNFEFLGGNKKDNTAIAEGTDTSHNEDIPF